MKEALMFINGIEMQRLEVDLSQVLAELPEGRNKIIVYIPMYDDEAMEAYGIELAAPKKNISKLNETKNENKNDK